MAGEWLSYSELAERLGLVSAEAARQRAIRAKWRRQPGNDGKARVFVDLAEIPVRPPSERPDEPHTNAPTEQEMIASLQGHVATLREALARAEAGEIRE